MLTVITTGLNEIKLNVLLCCSGCSRAKRNHRSSRSQRRGGECPINNEKDLGLRYIMAVAGSFKLVL